MEIKFLPPFMAIHTVERGKKKQFKLREMMRLSKRDTPSMVMTLSGWVEFCGVCSRLEQIVSQNSSIISLAVDDNLMKKIYG